MIGPSLLDTSMHLSQTLPVSHVSNWGGLSRVFVGVEVITFTTSVIQPLRSMGSKMMNIYLDVPLEASKSLVSGL